MHDFKRYQSVRGLRLMGSKRHLIRRIHFTLRHDCSVRDRARHHAGGVSGVRISESLLGVFDSHPSVET